MVKKPAKRAAKKPAPKPKLKARPAQEWPRDPGLEQAIIDAPLDPVPRMVYADWLQAAGDRRGEWMALHTAIENDPKNVRLRSAAVDFLGTHLELLLGPGKALLVGGWIGWRAGFIDELRVQPSHRRHTVAALAGLLAHPSSRFVRCIGLGDLGQEAIDAVVGAAPPLLETVVVVDTGSSVEDVEVDALVALPSIRRLGLRSAKPTEPVPHLRELSCYLSEGVAPWIAKGGCPDLERLTLDCDRALGTLTPILDAVPKLRQLRLLHVGGELEPVMALRDLELLDLSYGRIGDAEVERFAGWRGLRLVLHRTAVSAEAVARLRHSGVEVIASAGTTRLINDEQTDAWLHYRLATDGRDGIATLPGIGRTVFNIGTHHSMYGDPKDATPLLDAALTFPDEHLKTWAWANAAIAHERLHQFDDAELIAREGLLRTPKEPNLYAIIVDALRRTDRLQEAIALLPRALASIAAKPGPGAHTGGRGACLADVALVLAQAGRHDEVIELAGEHEELVKARPDISAIVAMSLVACGRLPEARKALARAAGSQFAGVLAHARAVIGLTARRPDLARVLQHLRDAKAAPYPEWHWIARDPNLAKLRGNAAFEALLA